MKLKNYILFALLPFVSVNASEIEDVTYRRNSLYTVMINHTEQQFANEIRDCFISMPVSDKYNDHNLSVKILNTDNKKLVDEKEISDFISRNNIPSRMVAQWFNRDIRNGLTNMELIFKRGLYSASELDKIKASNSIRGNALLEDAGVELIGSTFLLVNEIRYVNKEETSKAVGSALRIVGALAAEATGNSSYSDLGNALGGMAESIKGFKVKIYSHLYQLEWNEEVETDFYMNAYTESIDEEKKNHFEKNRDKFKMKYLGCEVSKGNMTSFMGIKEDQPEIMIRKACQRALDENIASLQKEYEPFKIKSPLLSVEPLTAPIGLKEGISKESRFEVLEKVLNKDGKYEYKRVGVIRPIESAIWDNRYMAKEEQAYGANFEKTTFQKVSGSDFYPGMLIREIK